MEHHVRTPVRSVRRIGIIVFIFGIFYDEGVHRFIFLFLFLPLVLLAYLLVGNRARNMVLLCASLFFYAWGESLYLIVMLFSIASNYVFGLSIDNAKRQGKSGLVPLVLAVAANLGMLAFFKYANFFILICFSFVFR